MTERLHQNEARVEELTKNWTSKWRETQKIIEVKINYLQSGRLRKFALMLRKKVEWVLTMFCRENELRTCFPALFGGCTFFVVRFSIAVYGERKTSAEICPLPKIK